MYDSVTASNIPTNPPPAIVAGYINGLYAWSAADWSRFPNSRHVTITIWPTTTAEVMDVEYGDATPTDVPKWLSKFRPDPSVRQLTVYCSLDTTWPKVQSAVSAAGIAPPAYWIADYIGTAFLIAGSTATQWTDTRTLYDISETNGTWPTFPGLVKPTPPIITPPPLPSPPKPKDDELITALTSGNQRHVWVTTTKGATVRHYWQDNTGPTTAWHVETMTATAKS